MRLQTVSITAVVRGVLLVNAVEWHNEHAWDTWGRGYAIIKTPERVFKFKNSKIFGEGAPWEGFCSIFDLMVNLLFTSDNLIQWSGCGYKS